MDESYLNEIMKSKDSDLRPYISRETALELFTALKMLLELKPTWDGPTVKYAKEVHDRARDEIIKNSKK